MRRRIECINGLQDVMSQVGQVDDGIGHHCFDVGCASHQKRDRGLLTKWRHSCLDGVILRTKVREEPFWNVGLVNTPCLQVYKKNRCAMEYTDCFSEAGETGVLGTWAIIIHTWSQYYKSAWCVYQCIWEWYVRSKKKQQTGAWICECMFAISLNITVCV